MNNFCRLMFALIFLPLMSLGITKQSNAYQLNGKVTGLLATNNKCYVAIHDDNDKYYSDQWHLAGSDAICHFAKMAYLMNISVITEVDIDFAPANANNIRAPRKTSDSINDGKKNDSRIRRLFVFYPKYEQK